MKILFVIPSMPEFEVICKTFPQAKSLNSHHFRTFHRHVMLDFLVPGPGSAPMILHLDRRLSATHYDLVMLAGICGSWRNDLKPGQVVRISQDQFADLGADSPGGFLPASSLGIYLENESWQAGPIRDNPGRWVSLFNHLPAVKAITLNTVTGSAVSIERNGRLWDPDTESMEGAAFFYVCRNEKLNFVQLRAVSNMVEPRNRENWQLHKALDNLSKELEKIVSEIHDKN